MGLSCGVVCVILGLAVLTIPGRDKHTGGQTHTTAYTALAYIASRGKNRYVNMQLRPTGSNLFGRVAHNSASSQLFVLSAVSVCLSDRPSVGNDHCERPAEAIKLLLGGGGSG